MKRFSRMLAVGGVSALLCEAGPVDAQEPLVCQPEVIVALSERILANREAINSVRSYSSGAQAAYLRYHYGAVSDEEMLLLLDRLSEGERREQVRDAREMALALAVSRDGLSGLLRNGRLPLEEVGPTFLHLSLAILELDAGTTFFGLYPDEMFASDVSALTVAYRRGAYVSALVYGKEDAFLGELATNAEAADHPVTAIMVAANMQGGSLFVDLMERYAWDPEVTEALPIDQLDFRSGTWVSQVTPRFEEMSDTNLDLFHIVRADSQTALYGWMAIATDQSGLTQEFGTIARGFLTEVESGNLDPRRNVEAAWLWQYQQFLDVAGRDVVGEVLGSFTWPKPGDQYASRTALESFEDALLYDALAFALPQDFWPEAPANILAEDWAAGRVLIEELRSRPEGINPQSEDDAVLIFEVLWRSGDINGAIGFVERTMEPRRMVNIFKVLNRRMDRACDGILSVAGQNPLLAGTAIYRFPPVVNTD